MEKYGSGLGSGYPEPAQQARTPQVDHQLVVMQESIDRIDKLVCGLHDRLSPIILDAINKTQAGSEEPACMLAPLAERIRNGSFQLNHIEDRLHRILDTLEI